MQLPSVHVNPKIKGHILKVGDVVLLNDPSKDRCDWPIGVVTKVFQSGDEIIRSAEIKIEENGDEKTVTRSTGRLVLLEAADEHLPTNMADSNEGAEDVASNPPTDPMEATTSIDEDGFDDGDIL